MKRSDEYRNNIFFHSEMLQDLIEDAGENSDLGKNYISVEFANEILDEIESIVGDVKDRLEKIQGLTEIEDIKEIVEALADKLY